MRRKKSKLWVLCLVSGFLFLTAISNAAVEGIPCTPEPIDMPINYGDLVTCSIDPVGDTDSFRFIGYPWETVLIQATRHGGGGICIWLYRADGTLVSGNCGNPATRIVTTLDQIATYTILVNGWNNDGAFDYTLVLDRLVPLSPSARAIQFGELRTDEINPVGDLDIFYFVGKAGETITLQAARQSGGDPCVELYGANVTCNTTAAAITATLDEDGTYPILISEWGNNAPIGYALDLQCLSSDCGTKPPDLAGCINLQGSPLADRNVVLKQYLEPDQTAKTNANGCYKFDNAVSGKKFRVIIKGPVIP